MRMSLLFSAGLGLAVFAMNPAMAATVTVSITDFTFSPATVTVHPGDKVVWHNGDSVPHTATALDGKSFGTGAIDPGASASAVLSKPGEYRYHCAIHPDMVGAIDVK